jgi:hypothetical protein
LQRLPTAMQQRLNRDVPDNVRDSHVVSVGQQHDERSADLTQLSVMSRPPCVAGYDVAA